MPEWRNWYTRATQNRVSQGMWVQVPPPAQMNKILVILGATATGKSDLAVKLAKKYNGEVISADSRQVYKGLDIGTGKITTEEMQGIKHHMLDVVDPNETFTVAGWQKQTEEIIEKILDKNMLPIICGGTGFYIQAIVDGLVLPTVPPNDELRKELDMKTLEELQNILEKTDPERYANIDTKNKVRLVRAIEIAESLGSVPKIHKKDSKYEILQIGLRVDDEELKSKIKNRVVSRIKKGMVLEAENLHKNGLSFERMKELGLEYGLLSSLLQNEITEQEFEERLQTEIWQYAKRQNTWFKKDDSIKWFNPNETEQIEFEVKSWLS